MSQKDSTIALTYGFTGILRSWWDNHLTKEQRDAILNSKRIKDEVGAVSGSTLPPTNPPQEEDSVTVLVYTLVKYFCGTIENQKLKNDEALEHLTCTTMADYKWYKDSFLVRLYQRTDCRLPFYKLAFVQGCLKFVRDKFQEKNECQRQYQLGFSNLQRYQ